MNVADQLAFEALPDDVQALARRVLLSEYEEETPLDYELEAEYERGREDGKAEAEEDAESQAAAAYRLGWEGCAEGGDKTPPAEAVIRRALIKGGVL